MTMFAKSNKTAKVQSPELLKKKQEELALLKQELARLLDIRTPLLNEEYRIRELMSQLEDTQRETTPENIAEINIQKQNYQTQLDEITVQLQKNNIDDNQIEQMQEKIRDLEMETTGNLPSGSPPPSPVSNSPLSPRSNR